MRLLTKPERQVPLRDRYASRAGGSGIEKMRGGARCDQELVQPAGHDVPTIGKTSPGAISAAGNERSAPFGMTREKSGRTVDLTGPARNAAGTRKMRPWGMAVVVGAVGRRAMTGVRGSRARVRPHGTKRRRPCPARRAPKPRGPRSIRGRFPSARARTCPYVIRNPRTLRRVKVGSQRTSESPFSVAEAQQGRGRRIAAFRAPCGGAAHKKT